MPVVDPQVVEDIVNRPSLELLGIEVPVTAARAR
jgi:hypothetical protein